MLNLVIFSKNRACQLELLLRSLDRFFADRDRVRPSVLYTADAGPDQAAYDLTRERHPGVRFVLEDARPFKQQTLELIDPAQPLTMLLVDDDVFKAPFSLSAPEVETLVRDPDVACVSLRLDPHMNYCYPLERTTERPEIVDGCWRWYGADGDWGYPMSLDGHIFRTEQLLPLVGSIDFTNPNELEARLAERPLPLPKAVCTSLAPVVNVPANRVQDVAPNRHAGGSADALRDAYLAGRRIALEPFDGVRTRSPHAELEYVLEDSPDAPASGRSGFADLVAEAGRLRQGWPTAAQYAERGLVHPVWVEAQPTFARLVESLGEDFLRDPSVRHYFCRSGVGPLQLHEAAYLRRLPARLRSLIDRYEESAVGLPLLDAPGAPISVNSLGMLYFFARICERVEPSSLRTVVELGGGYGCMARVFRLLLPEHTYVLVDLPELLALQYVFLGGAARGVHAHVRGPVHPVPGRINLVPVHLADQIVAEADLFVSTLALSEAPRRVHELVADADFYGARAVYLVGQNVTAGRWSALGFEDLGLLQDRIERAAEEVTRDELPDADAWELLATGCAWSRRETRPVEGDRHALYSLFVRPGSLCVDVGANAGNRTDVFLELGASVIAVEPQSACMRRLVAKYEGDPRVLLVESALGADEREAELHLCSTATTISSMSTDWIDHVRASGRFDEFAWDRTERVAVTTLDRLIDEFGMPDFCKIDVEGYELEVVRGLSHAIRALSFEFTPEHGGVAAACVERLATLGDYEFNWSIGESMLLEESSWTGAAEMVETLETLPDRTIFGDVYARLRPDGLPGSA